MRKHYVIPSIALSIKKGEKMQVKDKFPDYVADLIYQENITQAHFAKKCGVTPGAVTQWINGTRRPKITRLKHIITAVMLIKNIARADATKEVCQAYLFEYGIV